MIQYDSSLSIKNLILSHSPFCKVPVDKIYSRLFPAAIRLACDIEIVARQLFEPLVMQLIHWFTKNMSYENVETAVLLDSIVEAVGNSTNGAIRDFSSKCLAEFLRWSIKQSTKKQQEENPFNAKSLFKRLYSLAHHPNPYKRLGCALTMRKLYRIFREEEALVDQFVLEITHNMLFSMRLAANDPESIGTEYLGGQVLESFARIIKYYHKKLLKKNPQRRMHHNLRGFVDWLFSEVITISSFYK